MKYIVYQTVCKVNNKIYIGVHCTNNPDGFDGYIGCGVRINCPASYMNPKTPFQFAVKKYGPKEFIRTTLAKFDTEEEAYELEHKLVNDEFLKRSDVYNLVEGGKFHITHQTPIYMYDLDGNFEREFDGINEAVRFVNPEHDHKGGSHIIRAINQGHQYHGHQFSYEKVDKLKNLTLHRKMATVERPYTGGKVGRYDDNGNLLEIFETMTNCIKAGYKNAKLVALGQREHCKGYVFKYLD